jgi:DNA mismatch repair protein MutH
MEWTESRVRRKLARVLWVPVRGERALAVERRQIGTPFLWSPTAEDEAALKNDWDELSGIIGRGDVDAISGHLGSVLQVRPKARNSRARRSGIDGDGMRVSVLPRGFYLRAAFTERLLRERLFVAQPGSSGDTGMGRPASPRAK